MEDAGDRDVDVGARRVTVSCHGASCIAQSSSSGTAEKFIAEFWI